MTPASYTSIRDDVDESSPNLMRGESDSSNTSGNFDCNICLEESQAPVVTMCGHLFCWSCIHRWITIHSELEECPVCKACIKDKIVPLYGRGKTEVANHGPKKIHRLARLHGAPCNPSTAPNVLQTAGYPYVGHQSYRFVAQQNYGLQGTCFTSSAVAFGLFPALFGVYGSTVTLENDGHQFRNSVSSMTFQHLHVNREHEFILYWFLILLAGFTISCLLLF